MRTHTSIYFPVLYDFAVELIRRGCAYVDHQTPGEMKEYREKKLNSPWRDRPISESLKLFEDMKRGVFEEGEATLRMKQDMQNENCNMRDLVAYRIKRTPHPRTGKEWVIYPTYDFAHCILDSFQHVSHSLRTLEFETRRASYYWLLHKLGMYEPYVREYSKLKVSNTVLSMDKLNRLVTENWVDGWDDPRLMTLAGLRRRGITSKAINLFLHGIGKTSRSDNSLTSVKCLEYHVRRELNKTAPRAMVVLNPLKVVITNVEANSAIEVNARKWPNAQADDPCAFYKIPFSNVIYIDRSDFQRQHSNDYYDLLVRKGSKDFHGLTFGKSVMLRYAFPIKCTGVVLDEDETLLEIRAEYDPSYDPLTKPKGVIQWVPGVDPLKVEVRLFDKLFLSKDPAKIGISDYNDFNYSWLDDINPKSKVIIPNAYGVSSLRNAKVGDSFQFERLGYFVVDSDSTPGKTVYNRIVTLKASYSKSGE